jgi:hypothetical protein
MVELPFSRFTLKRSTSLDSIQTGLNNLISRMHFSQPLQRETDTSDDECSIDAIHEDDTVKNDFEATSIPRQTITPVLTTERRSDIAGDKRRRNERISNERFSKNYVQEAKIQLSDDDHRKRSPRRCISYYDEYNKRESDRQKAREMAAYLIRAQKVKKEFSDGSKTSYNISPAKKSAKAMSRRSNNNGSSPQKKTLPVTTPTIFPDAISSKIRLHTTTRSFPSSSQGISSTRSSRNRVSPEN